MAAGAPMRPNGGVVPQLGRVKPASVSYQPRHLAWYPTREAPFSNTVNLDPPPQQLRSLAHCADSVRPSESSARRRMSGAVGSLAKKREKAHEINPQAGLAEPAKIAPILRIVLRRFLSRSTDTAPIWRGGRGGRTRRRSRCRRANVDARRELRGWLSCNACSPPSAG